MASVARLRPGKRLNKQLPERYRRLRARSCVVDFDGSRKQELFLLEVEQAAKLLGCPQSLFPLPLVGFQLEEEAGVIAVSMVKRGVLTFHFDDKPVPWEVHVFHVEEFVGEPCETEEMSPIWFSITDIPYDKMWKDDVIWYPPFLKGLSFRGDFFFKNTHELVSHSLQIVPIL